MDNARWSGFEPREGDVFVCMPSKCGKTWMQTIVANLIWPDGDFPGPIVNFVCPWIEAKFERAESMHERLRAQTHRRARRGASSLLFTHYNDLKADLRGGMRRVARFLDIDIPEAEWPAVIERCTFEAKRNAESPGMDDVFEGGRHTVGIG